MVTVGRYAEPIPVAVDAELFDGWDLVISIGQVVPHEVIGMANFTKNVVIGLGGAPTIHRSHFVGAVAGMEQIMGRTTSAVRDVVDAAFDRFVEPLVPVLWVLTVVEDVGAVDGAARPVRRRRRHDASGGAAFRAAADLARRTNIDIVDEPLDRVACWLDPVEMRSTWLGNKAVYRTRMAIADGGELIVLAPGVDALRRGPGDRHADPPPRLPGHAGDPRRRRATIPNWPPTSVPRPTSCTAAPRAGSGSSGAPTRPRALTRDEVEAVGYEWRPLRDELEHLGVGGDYRRPADASTATGAPSTSSPTRPWVSGRRPIASPDRPA